MGKPKNIVKSSTNCVSMSKMLIMKINNFGRYSSKRKSEAKINLSCVNKPCIVSYLSAEKLNRKYNKVSKEKKKLAVKLKEANLANERLKSSNRSLLKSEKSLLQDKVNLEEELAKAKKRVVRSKKEEDCVKSSSCLIVGKQRVTKADVKWVYSELNKCEKLLEQSTLEVNSLKEELVKPVVNVVHQFVAKLQKNMCTQTEDIKNGQNMNEFALKLSPKILSNKLDSNGLECSAMEVDSKFTEEKRQPIKELSKDFEDWLLRINIQELQNGKLAPRQVVESYLQYAPFNFLEEFLV